MSEKVAAADLIIPALAGREHPTANFAVTLEIFLLDTGDRIDNPCRRARALADWRDRSPGKVDLAAETRNPRDAVGGELGARANGASKQCALPAGIFGHLRGEMAENDELRQRGSGRSSQRLHRET